MRLALSVPDKKGFAAALMESMRAGHSIVLLPNLQPDTLCRYAGEYDQVITEYESQSNFSLDGIDPDLEIIFFTSGSTNEPKKVVKKFHHLIQEVRDLDTLLGPGRENCEIYSTVSHQHIYGFLFSILWPVATGRILTSTQLTIPEEIVALESAAKPYILISSPSFLSRFFAPNFRNHMCRLILSSGGNLDGAAAQKIAEIFGHSPFEILGSTETGGVAWRQQTTYWQAFPQVTVSICPTTSALQVKSPYFPEAQVTMGDAARMVAGNRFELLGRLDRIVKIEGKRISLPEMETALSELPEVEKAALIREVTTREQLAAFVVLSPDGYERMLAIGEVEMARSLRMALKSRFEPVTLPRRMQFLSEIPTTTQGKLDRHTLEAL